MSPLKPLVVLMRILGVDLDLTIDSSNCYRYVMLVYGLVLLGLNFYLQGCVMALEFPETSNWNLSSTSIYHHLNSTGAQSSTFAWNTVIDYVSYAGLTLGVHSVLPFLVLTKKWRTLWSNVALILHDEKGFPHTGQSIKRATIIGLVIVLLVFLLKYSFSYEVMKIFFVFFNKYTGFCTSIPTYLLKRKPSVTITYGVVRILGNLVQIYAFSGLLLFAIISWTVVVGFRQLRNELIDMLLTNNTKNKRILTMDSSLEAKLLVWRVKHVLLCDTVDGINDCFGLILLVWVTHMFASFITIPFYILQELRYQNSDNMILLILNSCLLIELTIECLVVTIIPSRIYNEVTIQF